MANDVRGAHGANSRRRAALLLVVVLIAGLCVMVWGGLPSSSTHEPFVSGTVAFRDGSPATTVEINVPEWNKGAITNSEGRFFVTLPAAATKRDSILATFRSRSPRGEERRYLRVNGRTHVTF